MRNLCLILVCFLVSALHAQEAPLNDFIDRYKEIAIAEMHRTGIPASIKLAQAILESDAGRSDLATNAKNFFGIKCGVGWEDGTYFKDDDDFDHRGRLIPSCFREFESAEASFIAHSDFLMDPRKEYRYGSLFNIDMHDYKSWAWGLKDAGYATNPRYANLLIKIIERHSLNSFDYYQPQKLLASSEEVAKQPKPMFTHSHIEHKTMQRPAPTQKKPEALVAMEGIVTNNGLEMVYANVGDTPESIAAQYGKSLKRILEYNEELKTRNEQLEFADRVYFQKKKRAYRGSIKEHKVQEGETMYQIAQAYGLQLERLYIRNRLFPGTEPAVGEKVRLRGMVKAKNRPKLRYVHKESVEVVAPVSRESARTTVRKKHIVSAGETLYAIANVYALTVNSLIQINNLDSNLIRPGQVLFVD